MSPWKPPPASASGRWLSLMLWTQPKNIKNIKKSNRKFISNMIFDLNLVHSVLVHYHFVLVCIWLKQNNLTAKIFLRRFFWPRRCWVKIYFSVFNIFRYVWYSKPPCGSCFYCLVECFECMSWMSPNDDDHGDDDYDDPYSMVMITKWFWSYILKAKFFCGTAFSVKKKLRKSA